MNKIKYLGCEVHNARSVKSRADVTVRKTIEYLFDKIIMSYYTPDDVAFEVGVTVNLRNTSPNILVVCDFIPIKLKNNLSCYNKRLPHLVMELNYKTDVEMTEKLYYDIMKMLSHLGLASLYNTSSNAINAIRGEA